MSSTRRHAVDPSFGVTLTGRSTWSFARLEADWAVYVKTSSFVMKSAIGTAASPLFVRVRRQRFAETRTVS
jgi:hypothetical protein